MYEVDACKVGKTISFSEERVMMEVMKMEVKILDEIVLGLQLVRLSQQYYRQAIGMFFRQLDWFGC